MINGLKLKAWSSFFRLVIFAGKRFLYYVKFFFADKQKQFCRFLISKKGGEVEKRNLKLFLMVDVFQMWGLLCYINVSIIHWEPLYSRLLTHKMIIHLTSKMLMLKEIRHLHHKEENTCFAFTKVSTFKKAKNHEGFVIW